MAVVSRYRLWCSTDSKWEYVWDNDEPTVCPVNPAHTIDSSKIDIIRARIRRVRTTVDPTVTDDKSKGYGISTRWTNTTTKTIFICTKAAIGAAIWKRVPIVFDEKLLDLGTSSSGTWVSRAVTGGANRIAQITFLNTFAGTKTCGAREVGSSLERKFTVGKNNTLTLLVNVDGSGNIETNTDDLLISINCMGLL